MVFGHYHGVYLNNGRREYCVMASLYKAEEIYVEAKGKRPTKGKHKANRRTHVSVRPWYQPFNPYLHAAVRIRHMSRIPYLVSFPNLTIIPLRKHGPRLLILPPTFPPPIIFLLLFLRHILHRDRRARHLTAPQRLHPTASLRALIRCAIISL